MCEREDFSVFTLAKLDAVSALNSGPVCIRLFSIHVHLVTIVLSSTSAFRHLLPAMLRVTLQLLRATKTFLRLLVGSSVSFSIP